MIYGMDAKYIHNFNYLQIFLSKNNSVINKLYFHSTKIICYFKNSICEVSKNYKKKRKMLLNYE